MEYGDRVTSEPGEQGIISGGSLQLENHRNIFFQSSTDAMILSHFRVSEADSESGILSTEFKTVPGKEYTLTFDFSNYIGIVAPAGFGDSLSKVGIADANNETLEEQSRTVGNTELGDIEERSQKITFTATTDISKMYISLSSPATDSNYSQIVVRARNINIVKSDTQVQKELDEQNAYQAALDGVKDLFVDNNVDSGSLKDTVNQESLDNVQDLINGVIDEDKKAELQADLDTAQDLLNDKITAEQAEKDRQEAAEDGVKDLFKDEDVASGELKPGVDQETLDNVQDLINAVTDEDKKADLQADLDIAQDLLDQMNTTTGEVEVNEFVLGTDNNITGTYNGDVKRVTVTVNGKEYRGGTLTEGALKFYSLDKIKNVNDEVVIRGLDQAGKVLDTETVQISKRMIVTAGTINPNTVVIPVDKNITGNYTGDVRKVIVTVNGKEYRGGTLVAGEFKFYSLDKIKSITDEVVITALDSKDKVLDTKTVQVSDPQTTGTISLDTLTIPGDRNIVGTYTGDVKRVVVTVNGTEYRGGTVANGAIQFYSLDKVRNATDIVNVTALDAYGQELDSTTLILQPRAQ